MNDIIRCKSCVWYEKIDHNKGICVWRVEPKTKNSSCPEWMPKERRTDEVCNCVYGFASADDRVLRREDEMSDTISRQAAIDAICFICQGNDRKCSHYPCEEAEALKKLPSAERKKGKWIGEPKDGIEAMFFKPKCSVCGFESADGKNYCPNCGADMRGDADAE